MEESKSVNVLCHAMVYNNKEIKFDVIFCFEIDGYGYWCSRNFVLSEFILSKKILGDCKVKSLFSLNFYKRKRSTFIFFIIEVSHFNSFSNLGRFFHYKFYLNASDLEFHSKIRCHFGRYLIRLL